MTNNLQLLQFPNKPNSSRPLWSNSNARRTKVDAHALLNPVDWCSLLIKAGLWLRLDCDCLPATASPVQDCSANNLPEVILSLMQNNKYIHKDATNNSDENEGRGWIEYIMCYYPRFRTLQLNISIHDDDEVTQRLDENSKYTTPSQKTVVVPYKAYRRQ